MLNVQREDGGSANGDRGGGGQRQGSTFQWNGDELDPLPAAAVESFESRLTLFLLHANDQGGIATAKETPNAGQSLYCQTELCHRFFGDFGILGLNNSHHKDWLLSGAC